MQPLEATTMHYPQNPDAARHLTELMDLSTAAVSGDVLTDSDGGFLRVMSCKTRVVQRDIPAGFEMYTLLTHFLPKLALHAVNLSSADVLLAPAVLYDEPAGRLVALIQVNAHELELVAYWLSAGIRSDIVKGLPGLLAVPFSIEAHEGRRHLIPEWFAAFYVDGNEDHCVPILALQSIIADERMGDWVSVAFERMGAFGLPCDTATQAIRHQKAK